MKKNNENNRNHLKLIASIELVSIFIVLILATTVFACEDNVAGGGTPTSTPITYVNTLQFKDNLVTDAFFYENIESPILRFFSTAFKEEGKTYTLSFTDFNMTPIENTGLPDYTQAVELPTSKTSVEATTQLFTYTTEDGTTAQAYGLEFNPFTTGFDSTKLATTTYYSVDNLADLFFKITITEIIESDGSGNPAEGATKLPDYDNKEISGKAKRGVYQIRDYNDLLVMKKDLSQDYTLYNGFSIDLDSDWTSMGTLTGSLDGNNKTITITRKDKSSTTIYKWDGLFDTISSTTKVASTTDYAVQNLTINLEDITLKTSTSTVTTDGAGILAKQLKITDTAKANLLNIEISSSSDKDTVDYMIGGFLHNVGSVVGLIDNSTSSTNELHILNIRSNLELSDLANTTGTKRGGLFGFINGGTSILTSLEFNGDLESGASIVGGLVGKMQGGDPSSRISGTIGNKDSVLIYGKSKIGGIAGEIINAKINLGIVDDTISPEDKYIKIGSSESFIGGLVGVTSTQNSEIIGVVNFTHADSQPDLDDVNDDWNNLGKGGIAISSTFTGDASIGGAVGQVEDLTSRTEARDNIHIIGNFNIRIKAPKAKLIGGVVGFITANRGVDAITIRAQVGGNIVSGSGDNAAYIGGIAGYIYAFSYSANLALSSQNSVDIEFISNNLRITNLNVNNANYPSDTPIGMIFGRAHILRRTVNGIFVESISNLNGAFFTDSLTDQTMLNLPDTKGKGDYNLVGKDSGDIIPNNTDAGTIIKIREYKSQPTYEIDGGKLKLTDSGSVSTNFEITVGTDIKQFELQATDPPKVIIKDSTMVY